MRKIQTRDTQSNLSVEENSIVNEIFKGLTAGRKYIPSRFLYDDHGSLLFQKITESSEYYLTRTEMSIIRNAAVEITDGYDDLEIIELGSGNASKISIIMDALSGRKAGRVKYYPVDISERAIRHSVAYIEKNYPWIETTGIQLDFMKEGLLTENSGTRIICFFGSTIGNLSDSQIILFLSRLKEIMKGKDSLIIGFDMVKDTGILEQAYNDREGVTAAFNKNILLSVNALAGTDFITSDFDHFAFFNMQMSRIEMHLRARKNVTVRSPYLLNHIHIKENESIHTENSYKFTFAGIGRLAKASGLSVRNIYTDDKKYFSVVKFSI